MKKASGIKWLFIIFLLVFSFWNIGYADEEYRINLKLENFDEISENLEKEVGSNISIYKIKEDHLIDNYQETISELEKLSEKELNEKYEKIERPLEIDFDQKLVSFHVVEEGSYYVRNIFNPDNIEFTSPFIAMVKKGKKDLTIDPKNMEIEKPLIKILKVDEKGNRLPGASFKLVNKKESKEKIYTSDRDGEIVIYDLDFGAYSLEEIKAPDGYVLDRTVHEIRVDENREYVFKFVNQKEKYGDFKFRKVDNSSKKNPLEGAKFKVIRILDGKKEPVIKNNKQVVLESGKDGYFKVENLSYGSYELWEIEAPKGYKRLDRGVSFEISENSYKKLINIKNYKKPTIDIPQTGDLVSNFILLGSVASFGTGFYISKKKDKKKNNKK